MVNRRPSPEEVAIGQLIWDSFAKELRGKTFQEPLGVLTGYTPEVLAHVQSLIFLHVIQTGGCDVDVASISLTLGAWLARKNAENQLAHLAGVAKRGN